MLIKLKRPAKKLALAVTLGLGLTSTASAVELTMYYPVAVGGSLTKIVDGLVGDFMKENPDIKVNAIYAGNYNDARIKALAALKSGKPAQTSVMFSIDMYELIEQGAIVAFDDVVKTADEKKMAEKLLSGVDGKRNNAGKNLGYTVSAFNYCDVLQQRCIPRRRPRPRSTTGNMGRNGIHWQKANQEKWW
jgi:sn-glycerol 3-phosphate transport system substrate-binding protein